MRKKLLLLAVLLAALIIGIRFTANFDAAAHQFCKYDVNNALNAELSRQLLLFTLENKELQESVCSYDRSGGTLRSITVNPHAVSTITAMISSRLIETVRNFGESGFGMPLGNATGMITLSGKGPKIKIKTVPLGNIACDTESLFISAGINQTHFKLVLKITCAYEALAPFAKESGELCFTYTLCETVIVGDVPQLYLNK